MTASSNDIAGLPAGQAADLVAGLGWDSCALGPFSAWPAALQTAVRMMLASPFPMFIAWGADMPYLYNDACIPIVADKHPMAFGRPFREVWPEAWDELSPWLHQAMQGKASFHENMEVVLERNGAPASGWFTFAYSPLYDDAGQPGGVLSVAMEGTASVLAGKWQRVRQALDDHIRDLADPSEIGMAAASLLGEHLGCQDCFFAEIEQCEEYASVASSWTAGDGERRSGRHSIADLKGGGGLAVPLLKGGVAHVLVCGSRTSVGDWSDDDTAISREIGERAWAAIGKARAEEAVREAARELRLLTDALPVLIAHVDDDRCYRFNNRAYEDWFGHPREDIPGKHLAEVLGEEAYAELRPTIDRALAGERISIEQTVPFRSGGMRHVITEYVPRLNTAGTVIGYYSLVQDISERKRAEEHRLLLINELNHRVRNTLAVVQSLASQSFRPDMPLDVGRKAFEGRLRTLGAAHNLLTSENWDGATLQSVAREALAACADPARFNLSGPEIRLPPQTAVSFALALHELCTNALKYGALSVAGGLVSMEWSTSASSGPDGRLRFQWRELGGPPVTVPERRGFGSRLLETGLAAELRGQVTMDFSPDGLVCTIDAPLPAGK